MGAGSLSNNTFWSHKLVPHYFPVYQSMSYVTSYYHHHPETFIFQATETHKFHLVKSCLYSVKPPHWQSSSVSMKGLAQALNQTNVGKRKI